ncbi:MAG TPA: hypothetical protein VFV50_12220, partial [Bdellovibrionales bacterium]|nr:hypothetical protein [Bdellovibrionales bacterium]
ADCHGGPANRGHNFAAADASCVRCHSLPHKTQVGREYGCKSCHFSGFLVPYQFQTKPEFERSN